MGLVYFLVRAVILVTCGPALLFLFEAAVTAPDSTYAFFACVLAVVPAALLWLVFWPERSKDDEDGDSNLDVTIKIRRAGRGEYDATVTPRRRRAS